ncbi:MAG: cysteine hydrolase [Ruminococcus sp.]|nr:cysteine hydrolase [Ruminococcus sp.]
MKKILIAVDLQKDFVDGALGSPEAVAITEPAAEKIRAFDGVIFVTLDTHFENYMETAEGRKLPVPHCIKNTEGWQLNDKIAEALAGKNYTLVEKNTFGSVELPGLAAQAAGGEDFEIELIGLCTDICVVSNVMLLKARFPEVKITVDAACCAGVTPELHKAALMTMKSCQIDVIGAETA